MLIALPLLALLATARQVQSSAVTRPAAVIDPSGYLLYCGCMGRIGNQASHFIGVLALAKSINRTLVLPPYITYDHWPILLRPFEEFHNLSTLSTYHRVIPMGEFMDKIAPVIWPPEARHVYCSARGSKPEDVQCRAKEGNPFKAFWDAFGVDFASNRALFYGLLPFEWKRQYPPEVHPVIAMPGAPAQFPADKDHYPLAAYLDWNDEWRRRGQSVIDQHLSRPFVAAHVRAGLDWINACSHIGDPRFMESPQCDDVRPNPHAKFPHNVCIPSAEEMVADLVYLVTEHSYKSVFVGTDDISVFRRMKSLWSQRTDLQHIPLVVVEQEPMLDMVVFTEADMFIGNCASSFTAMATRHRRARDQPLGFWSLVRPESLARDEL